MHGSAREARRSDRLRAFNENGSLRRRLNVCTLATLLMKRPAGVAWNGCDSTATIRQGKETDEECERIAKAMALSMMSACEHVAQSGPMLRFLEDRPITRQAIFRQMCREFAQNDIAVTMVPSGEQKQADEQKQANKDATPTTAPPVPHSENSAGGVLAPEDATGTATGKKRKTSK